MPLSDYITIPLLVILVPMGFVWVSRHNASMQRARALLIWGVVMGITSLASLLAARGAGPSGMGAGLAFIAFGFVALTLISWSVQTAIAASLQKPQSTRDRILGKRRGPANFDPIDFRGLLALLCLNACFWGLLLVWLWTGSAKNLLRYIGILERTSPSVLTFASNYRHFTLQVFLLALFAIAALIALFAQYRSMSRRGQV